MFQLHTNPETPLMYGTVVLRPGCFAPDIFPSASAELVVSSFHTRFFFLFFWENFLGKFGVLPFVVATEIVCAYERP